MVQSNAPSTANVAAQSVEKLRDVVGSGRFYTYAEVDKQTGEVKNAEARALFASLPAVTPSTRPEELVENQLLTGLPNGLYRCFEIPKYRVGREVFVRSTVEHKSQSRMRPVGAYSEDGPVTLTHRGILKAQRGEDFLVELPGAASWQAFSKADLFSWNEPIGVPASGGNISGVQIDYNDPLWKAHICAAYLEIAEDVAALDFHGEDTDVIARQEKLLYALASRMAMTYAGKGEGYTGTRAGPLFREGQGVCFVQRAVMGGFLQAFSRVLAIDLQLAVGMTLDLGLPHGFVIVTLRPSMVRYVCDPAWAEPLTELRVAFFGPSWGHNRRLEGFEGVQELTVRPDEIDLPTEEMP